MALFLFSVRNLLSPWFTATSKTTKSPAMMVLEICQIFYCSRELGIAPFQISYTSVLWEGARWSGEVSSFTRFGDKIQDKPNFSGVTWSRLRLLPEILYLSIVGRGKLKLCTKLELSSFTSFGDIFEGMPKILEVTWQCHAGIQKCCRKDQDEAVCQFRTL